MFLPGLVLNDLSVVLEDREGDIFTQYGRPKEPVQRTGLPAKACARLL